MWFNVCQAVIGLQYGRGMQPDSITSSINWKYIWSKIQMSLAVSGILYNMSRIDTSQSMVKTK